MQSEELWHAAIKAQEGRRGDDRAEMTDLHVVSKEVSDLRLTQWVYDLIYRSTPVAEYLWEDLLSVISALKIVPDLNKISIKETLVRVAAEYWCEEGKLLLQDPTDLLRLFAFLMAEDVSLAKPVSLKGLKFSRPQRKAIVLFLQKFHQRNQLVDSLQKYRGLWLSIARFLHLGDYKKEAPGVVAAFHSLYKNEIVSLDSKLVNSDFEGKLAILEDERPGLFIRWITRLVKEGGTDAVCESLSFIEDQLEGVPLPLLLTAYVSLLNDGDRVVVNKKGNIRVIPPRESGRLEEVALVLRSIIYKRLKTPGIGNIYIDPALAKLVVPLAARKQSEGLLTCGRGSRISIPENVDILRMFVYWKETRMFVYWEETGERTDLDLSMLKLSSEFKTQDYLSFSNYGDGANYAHSGDIQSGHMGATEFIDIRLDKLPRKGVLMPSILVYTGTTFKDLEACHFGWMYRTAQDWKSTGGNAGDALREQAATFDPKTVADKVTASGGGTLWLPMVVDLEKKRNRLSRFLPKGTNRD